MIGLDSEVKATRGRFSGDQAAAVGREAAEFTGSLYLAGKHTQSAVFSVFSELIAEFWNLIGWAGILDGWEVFKLKIDCGLDKLSAMHGNPDVAKLQRGLERLLAIDEVRDLSADNWARQSVKTAGGLYLEVHGYGAEKELRSEFNPAKADEQTYAEWSQVREHTGVARATRLDVAIDYFGYDVRNWQFEFGGRKSAWHYDRSQEFTGVTFGVRASKEQVTVYDKSLEQGEGRGEVMRVEVRYRPVGGEVLPLGLMDSLLIVGGLRMGEVTFSQRCQYLAWESDHSVLGFANGTEKSRFRQLLRDYGVHLEPQPEEVYLRERASLADELGFWLGADAVR